MKTRKFTIYGCMLLAFALIASAGLSLASNDLHEGTANMTALGCVGCTDGLSCEPPLASNCILNCPSNCEVTCSGASGWECGSGTFENCNDGTNTCGSVQVKSCWDLGLGICICAVPHWELSCGGKGWCGATG